jgi:succinyl-diaminopimelate desuccinylase
MRDLQEHLRKLVAYPSITPDDKGCQDYMIHHLENLGFKCQRFDSPPVSNFFARIGEGKPLLMFAGHTDVVPIGEISKWNTDPFTLHEKDGMLYGRGAADMKGSLASMLDTATRFVTTHPNFQGSLGFLITSGEEGVDFDLGTPVVMRELHQQGILPDYCIVGEPSSLARVGDVIKIGRRGSLTGYLTLEGKQGHVAYPHLAVNPIHKIVTALVELTTTQFDEGNLHFPATTLQVFNIQSGGEANNVIPGELSLGFNLRYSTESTEQSIKNHIVTIFNRHGLSPRIKWRLSGKPFLTSQGKLIEYCIHAIKEVTGQTPELSTSGGTSDGRFIAPYGVELLELGPVNATIHQINECVALRDLIELSGIYYTLCCKLLLS